MITLLAAISFVGAGQSPKKQPSSNVQLEGKVYARTQPISLTGDGAVLDGHGATLQGNGGAVAVQIGAFTHVTVKNLKLAGFAAGIVVQGATDISLVNVTVAGGTDGLRLTNLTGGLIQGVRATGCKTGASVAGCSKLILEKCELTQAEVNGLHLSHCADCVIRDNRFSAVGPIGTSPDVYAVGMRVDTASTHNQILRDVAVHCQACGILVTSDGGPPSNDNTLQGNDVSWNPEGLVMNGGTGSKILDNTAGYCKVGLHLTKVADTQIARNLLVGNTGAGILDDTGQANRYESNVFVRENGGPIAMSLKGTSGVESKNRVFQNVFMGFDKPLYIDNVSPLTLQSNSFPWFNSVQPEDVAQVVGPAPVILESTADQPKSGTFVESVGSIAQIPTIYDRLGGVRVAGPQEGETEFVVEGSLSGAFQGEQEELVRYKGSLPIDLTFPPRFEAFVRVHQLAERPVFITFLALLGDNSIAKEKPAEDSEDTLFSPDYAVDGDPTMAVAWGPQSAKAGEWWEVDLKTDRTINAFSVLPPPSAPNDFWHKFHIAVSSSGLFDGEETTVATETDLTARPGPLRVYKIPPIHTRYVRVISDVDQDPAHVKLKQFGVYGISQ